MNNKGIVRRYARDFGLAAIVPILTVSVSVADDDPDPPDGHASRPKAASQPAGMNASLEDHTDLFTGAFGYRIPIDCPIGRNESTPELSLAYNSESGNGWCGVGWSLEPGFIQRDTRRAVPVKWGATA